MCKLSGPLHISAGFILGQTNDLQLDLDGKLFSCATGMLVGAQEIKLVFCIEEG